MILSLFALLLWLVWPLPSASEVGAVREGARLSLDECVDVALRTHPSINGARYAVRSQEALVGQARSGYFPKLDTSLGYTRNMAERSRNDKYFPIATYSEHQAKASLSQTMIDFGRTSTDVRQKTLDLQASRYDLSDTMALVVQNVRAAYYGVLRAQRTADVAVESVGQYRSHLEQARALFEAGSKPKYDVTKAELDLSNAQLELITAENDLKLAWVSLNNAMGIDSGAAYSLEDVLSMEPHEITLEEAVDRAYAQRSDLQSLAAQRDSAVAAADLAGKEYYPKINGTASYSFLGSRFPLEQQWNAGVQLQMNLFEGYLTKNKIEESQAKVKVVESKITTVKLQILQEVKKAYLNMRQAREKIGTTEVQVRQATENLELANLRYTAGLAGPLEVTDATVSSSRAKLARIAALYDYKIEQANLERAMGGR